MPTTGLLPLELNGSNPGNRHPLETVTSLELNSARLPIPRFLASPCGLGVVEGLASTEG